MLNFPSRCQHIKVNGTQCGCPALRRNRFCYFHKRYQDERIQLHTDRARRSRNVTIALPVLEDAESIQVTLMQVMRLIVAGQIDGKTAGLLLYALQTASANLPRVRFEPYLHDVVLDPKTVDETPLQAHVWDDSDFISDDNNNDDDDDEANSEAQEAARLKAKRKAELKSEAEADRIIEEGIREREAHRQAAIRQAASFPPGLSREPFHCEPPAKSAVPPAAPSPGKRPSSNVNMDDVRKQVSDTIRKALPAVAVAQSTKQNGNSSG
jgi:hypothetical protein